MTIEQLYFASTLQLYHGQRFPSQLQKQCIKFRIMIVSFCIGMRYIPRNWKRTERTVLLSMSIIHPHADQFYPIFHEWINIRLWNEIQPILVIRSNELEPATRHYIDDNSSERLILLRSNQRNCSDDNVSTSLSVYEWLGSIHLQIVVTSHVQVTRYPHWDF